MSQQRLMFGRWRADSGFAALSADARDLWYALNTTGDSWGCLKVNVVPIRNEAFSGWAVPPSIKEVDVWLDELRQSGFLRCWTVDGKEYGEVKWFVKEQRIRYRRRRETPTPPWREAGDDEPPPEGPEEPKQPAKRQRRSATGKTPATQRCRREEKRREEKRREENPRAQARAPDPEQGEDAPPARVTGSSLILAKKPTYGRAETDKAAEFPLGEPPPAPVRLDFSRPDREAPAEADDQAAGAGAFSRDRGPPRWTTAREFVRKLGRAGRLDPQGIAAWKVVLELTGTWKKAQMETLERLARRIEAAPERALGLVLMVVRAKKLRSHWGALRNALDSPWTAGDPELRDAKNLLWRPEAPPWRKGQESSETTVGTALGHVLKRMAPARSKEAMG